jgi:hypothetical protein
MMSGISTNSTSDSRAGLPLRPQFLFGVAFFGGVLLVAALALFAFRGKFRTEKAPLSGQTKMEASADSARTEPLRIPPLVKRILPLSEKECSWVRQQIQPPYEEKIPAAAGYHLLRVHGRQGRFHHRDFQTGDDFLALLVDSRKSAAYYGKPTLVRTRTGIRFPIHDNSRNDGGTEWHRDQCLAAFAELGLPLTFPLKVDEQSHSLREMLRDSLANFHLQQKELAWTGLAYALYLPPGREWSNRFGERFSFDDLVTALIERPLHKESCGGSHLLYTLTVLCRVDRAIPILSDPVRFRLNDWLHKVGETATRTQHPDGTWPIDWYRGLLHDVKDWNYNPGVDRLVITGHVAEWLLYVPEDMQPAAETYRRSAQWLYQELKKASLKQQWARICPFSHAACVVRQLMFDTAEKKLGAN